MANITNPSIRRLSLLIEIIKTHANILYMHKQAQTNTHTNPLSPQITIITLISQMDDPLDDEVETSTKLFDPFERCAGAQISKFHTYITHGAPVPHAFLTFIQALVHPSTRAYASRRGRTAPGSACRLW